MCIYFIQAKQVGLIKIGYVKTLSNLAARLITLQTMSPDQLIFLGCIENGNDRWLHCKFGRSHSHGEWFRPSQELLDFIEENTTKNVIISGIAIPREIVIRQCSGITRSGERCIREIAFGNYCGSHLPEP